MRTEPDMNAKPQDADEATLYTHALGFLNRFISEANTRELRIRSRLEAQLISLANPESSSGTRSRSSTRSQRTSPKISS